LPIDQFEAATKEDPNFALTVSKLAQDYAVMKCFIWYFSFLLILLSNTFQCGWDYCDPPVSGPQGVKAPGLCRPRVGTPHKL
jgi:hypothetical protein